MRRREFTDEQIAFVRDNAQTMSTRELAGAFSERFCQPTGQTVIRRLMARNGIETQHDKRNDPAPAGTERWSEYYQCMMVKAKCVSVAGMGSDRKERDRVRNSQWVLKQNLIWEMKTGMKLPWRHVVVFLDGDRRNYDPDNLYAVPLNVAGTIEKMRMHSENAEIYKTALIWGELYFVLKGRSVKWDATKG